MQESQEFNIDTIIEKLLSVWGKKPGTLVNLRETEILYLIESSREVFM